MMSPASVYRIFRRPDGEAASVRLVILALVGLALALTAMGVIRVTRQHDVLRAGLKLSKASDHVRKLREARRQLELEYAVQSSPERIRRLATQLGMTTVAPDKIRVVTPIGPEAAPRAARAGKVATR
ncbi:MAG: cell division protein FtsL [Kofleriaceae bacterium]|nr:cell division protein FtsL [Kofleriaceae bacterium]